MTSLTLIYKGFRQIRQLKNSIDNGTLVSPFSYFVIAEVISELVYYGCVLYTYWLKSDAFVQIVEFLQDQRHYNLQRRLSAKVSIRKRQKLKPEFDFELEKIFDSRGKYCLSWGY